MPARKSSTRSQAGPSHRFEQLLRRDPQPWEDPECICEPEPRWQRFEHEGDAAPSEWESLERAPSEEL